MTAGRAAADDYARAQDQAAARMSAADLTAQMIGHGIFAILAGIVLVLTGPTTPSFRLFEMLPGWPVVAGIVHALTGGSLLVCRWVGGRPRLGRWALYALAWQYGIAGCGLAATYTSWLVTGRDGGEPLLVAVPVCLMITTHTLYLAGVARTRIALGLHGSCALPGGARRRPGTA